MKFSVKVDNFISDECPIKAGIPQASLLGQSSKEQRPT